MAEVFLLLHALQDGYHMTAQVEGVKVHLQAPVQLLQLRREQLQHIMLQLWWGGGKIVSTLSLQLGSEVSPYHFFHEGGTGGRGVHTEESGKSASLVTQVVVHFQKAVCLAGNGLDGHCQGR